MKHLLVMYGLDLLIVLLAIGAAVAANPERHLLPYPRWQLLLPGLLAFAGTVVLLSYPEIRDLADPELYKNGGGKLADLKRRHGYASAELAAAEASWLDLAQHIEDATRTS